MRGDAVSGDGAVGDGAFGDGVLGDARRSASAADRAGVNPDGAHAGNSQPANTHAANSHAANSHAANTHAASAHAASAHAAGINEGEPHLARSPSEPPGQVIQTEPTRTAQRRLPHPDFGELTETAGKVRRAIERVIEGKPDVVKVALTVLLAEGHLLIEDVPGVGKTMLSKALARSIDCSVRRIQFTPDLLPSDVTGVSVYNQETHQFEFRPGGIFANIVVGDEINRASPKTQSALLECMEERQVTVDGQTYYLDEPFMVIATQNPIEMEGTYPLPEAQRDRFTARVSMGYPSPQAELEMLDTHGGTSPVDELEPVADSHEIAKLIATVRSVYVAEPIKQYAVALTTATRSAPDLRLGASPRATLQLIRAARAAAALADREYVLPDDVQELAIPVLAHRLLPAAEAQIARRSAEQIVADIVASVPLPEPGRRGRR